MKEIIDRISKIRGECCVTITLNTHRTRPGFEKDPIQLKNLIKTAEEKMVERFDKRLVTPVIEKLKKMASDIDHGRNLDSLVMFANEEMGDFEKLPIRVIDKVVINTSFVVSDLIRADKDIFHYYVLVLSKDKARLLEAKSDLFITEVNSGFPVINTTYLPESNFEKTTGAKQTFLYDEFYNAIDKILHEIVDKTPLPVIVISELSSYHEFMKVTGNPSRIAGHLNHSIVNERNYRIIAEAWTVAVNVRNALNLKKLEDLEQARGKNTFLSEINEIRSAIKEGRGRILFIENHYRPSLSLQGDMLVMNGNPSSGLYSEFDAIDLLISEHMQQAGEIVFLPDGMSMDIKGVGLITRY